MPLSKYWPYPVVILLLVWTALSYRSAGRAEAEADASRLALHQSQDSLQTLKGTVASLQHDLLTAHGRVDTLRVRSDKTVAQAGSWGRVADSIRNGMTIRDTASSCKPILDAYNARTTECDLLKVAVQQKDSAIALGQIALVDASSKLLGVQQTVVGLQKQLLTVARPYTCKVLLFPCPSRTMTFVLGLVGGAVVMRTLH